MKDCAERCADEAIRSTLVCVEMPRFPDLRHRFRVGWRDALRALWGPAVRMHRLRNLRAELFDDAVDRLDARGRGSNDE
ncbi:MAG: hypothetical protein R3288_10975 [Woeseiaceae bacterium]|nr:hypothetical protein [Woeseiaceae bacterium]